MAQQKETMFNKVLVGVVVQAITATVAVTAGVIIAINVMATKIEHLKETDRRLETTLETHTNNGHPWPVIERVNSLESRVDRIEKRQDNGK